MKVAATQSPPKYGSNLDGRQRAMQASLPDQRMGPTAEKTGLDVEGCVDDRDLTKVCIEQ
jgi:hypothetical protein